MRPVQIEMRDAIYGELRPMKCPSKMLALAAAIALVLPQGAAPKQQQQQPPPPPQKSQAPPLRSISTEVSVPVTVKDANGDLVSTLREQDFRVFEDNVEQKITRIAIDPVPISTIILFDDALKTKPQEQLQASLRAIAGGFGDKDEVALFRFDQNPQQITDFISDPDQLLTQLGRLQVAGPPTMIRDPAADVPALPKTNGAPIQQSPPPMNVTIMGNGTKSINDALFAAAQLLRTRPKERRRIIFLLSDGVGSKGSKYSFDTTVRELLASETAVYSIGISTPIQDRHFGILARFGRATGGDVFYASERGDIERLYARVADQARNQYTLYYSPDHKDKLVTYHSIEVKVRMGGLDVHARDGYYSAPR